MNVTLFLLAAVAGTVWAQEPAYYQCGGKNFGGSTFCVPGYYCRYKNEWYSQCVPVSTTDVSTKTTATTFVTSKKTTQAATTTTTTTGATPTATSGSGSGKGKVSYAGINIAGFDFGCGTDGTCNTQGVTPPGSAGVSQIKHFVTDDGLNAFRLPVGWQYLVNNKLGGTLDSANLANYDSLVQGCLNADAQMCIIDIHNYARWNGEVIGQGGPTNAQFASLWTQLATKYKSNSKVAFGIMNEPHDLDMSTWASSVQAVVTAIRQAGAASNKILLPGTGYTSASGFSTSSGPSLQKVKNPDGSTTNLIFDVHKYADSDNSGTHAECTTNNVATFQTLGDWLRTQKRQAILTETGGGSNAASCITMVCQELITLNEYADVFLGWVGWSAGSFGTGYVLSETPSQSGGKWTDQALVQKCIAGQF